MASRSRSRPRGGTGPRARPPRPEAAAIPRARRGAVTRSTLTSAGVGKAFSARSYWARRSATVSESDGGSFARCARTTSMPRSAMSILLDAELSRDRSAIQDRRAVAVAEWRDVTEPGPVRARLPLRHRLEGGPHPGPGRAGPADGLPRHRHRQPAPALLRGRRSGRRSPRPTAAGVVARDELFLQTKFTYRRRPGPPAALRPDAADRRRRSSSRSPARSSTCGTDHIDSYVLHGPRRAVGLGRRGLARCGGRWRRCARRPGARACSASATCRCEQLDALCAGGAREAGLRAEPLLRRAAAGTATSARSAGAHGIVYQGFSLLTANRGGGRRTPSSRGSRPGSGPRRRRSCSASPSRWGCCR